MSLRYQHRCASFCRKRPSAISSTLPNIWVTKPSSCHCFTGKSEKFHWIVLKNYYIRVCSIKGFRSTGRTRLGIWRQSLFSTYPSLATIHFLRVLRHLAAAISSLLSHSPRMWQMIWSWSIWKPKENEINWKHWNAFLNLSSIIHLSNGNLKKITCKIVYFREHCLSNFIGWATLSTTVSSSLKGI